MVKPDKHHDVVKRLDEIRQPNCVVTLGKRYNLVKKIFIFKLT